MMSDLRPYSASAVFTLIAFMVVSLPAVAFADEDPKPADAPPAEPMAPPTDPPTDPPTADVSTEGPEQKEPTAVVAAESWLKAGQGMMELGQLEEACNKLQLSLDAYFLVDAALLLGRCQERRGLIASAWVTYRHATNELNEREDPRADEARSKAAALEAMVPRITMTMADKSPDIDIWFGKTRFGVGVLDVALAVDPGTHRIEVKRANHESWSREVKIGFSERKTIAIPALKATTTPATRTSKPSDSRTATATPTHSIWWTIGLVTGATGIVSLGVGGLLGGFAAAALDQATDDPALCGFDRTCTPEGRAKIDHAERLAVGSTVMFSVGGAALLAGFVMVLADRPTTGEDRAKVAVTPWLGPGVGGLSVGATF